ncbi:IS630 transposase-related protein [Rickettsia endosymbiont of Nabis limbatus]
MAKAYSYDLRIRVIKSLTDGKTIKETSEIYSQNLRYVWF